MKNHSSCDLKTDDTYTDTVDTGKSISLPLANCHGFLCYPLSVVWFAHGFFLSKNEFQVEITFHYYSRQLETDPAIFLVLLYWFLWVGKGTPRTRKLVAGGSNEWSQGHPLYTLYMYTYVCGWFDIFVSILPLSILVDFVFLYEGNHCIRPHSYITPSADPESRCQEILAREPCVSSRHRIYRYYEPLSRLHSDV